jgi:radical SAM superfamily enzyme YgiQ (UPF0313 family)
MGAVSRPLDIVHERLGRERGSTYLPGPHRIAMLYPSPYRAGMSSLGYQQILAVCRDAGLSVERAFLPDDVDACRIARQPLVTYETQSPVGRFPLVAVSLAYELEITGLIQALELAGIPPLRRDRGPHDPQVLIGGPISMASPLVAAPFADAMLLGEAEDTAPTGLAGFFDAADREAWLDVIEALPGGYVPERHGTRVPPIAKASDARLPAHSRILSPDAELSDMFLIEGERGCHRMCSFCVMRRTTNGGMRLVTPDRILSFIPDHARKVGLVGAAISDHPRLIELLETLVDDERSVSLSSLRADRIARKPRIAELLRASGARTLTVASDGASERLRKQMAKNTKSDHLRACAEQAGALGYSVFKVYMIVGLPDETDEDIDELVAFTNELSQLAGRTRVALGVAPLVAKRNTPLDGVPFAGIKVVEKRLKRLRKGLHRDVELRPTSARWAWVEHELSQGGPEAGEAMYRAHLSGGRFADVRRELKALSPDTRRPWAHHEVADAAVG